MKVLIVYPNFYVYGGGETLVVRLCNYLTRNGVTNAILTMNMIPQVRKDLINTEVHLFVQRYSSIGTLRALMREVKCRGVNFDIVNLHNYPAEIAAASSPKPTVWMCNEPELYLSLRHDKLRPKTKAYLMALSPYEKYVVRNHVDINVVSDEFNAARFKEIYGKYPTIIPYGIDVDYFSEGNRTVARDRLGISEEFIMLHVGMLTKLKNQMESLRVLNALKNEIKQVRLVLAGYWHDDYKKEVDAYIGENDLGQYVIMTGHLGRAELRDWYYTANVLIHPIKAQGGWLSPFEALCTGTPIIVSEEMTAAQMIKRNNLGEVSTDYRKTVLDIYNNPAQYRQKALAAACWVRDNLSWDKYGRRMLETFNAAAGVTQ